MRLLILRLRESRVPRVVVVYHSVTRRFSICVKFCCDEVVRDDTSGGGGDIERKLSCKDVPSRATENARPIVACLRPIRAEPIHKGVSVARGMPNWRAVGIVEPLVFNAVVVRHRRPTRRRRSRHLSAPICTNSLSAQSNRSFSSHRLVASLCSLSLNHAAIATCATLTDRSHPVRFFINASSSIAGSKPRTAVRNAPSLRKPPPLLLPAMSAKRCFLPYRALHSKKTPIFFGAPRHDDLVEHDAQLGERHQVVVRVEHQRVAADGAPFFSTALVQYRFSHHLSIHCTSYVELV